MTQKAMVLVRRCKTPAGWRRFPASFGKNGRVRPGFVQVGAEQVEYPVGTYEIRHIENRKNVFTPAGDQATEALALLHRMSRKRQARSVAADAGLVVSADQGDKTLRKWAEEFVSDAKQRGAMEAAAVNQRATDEFLAIVRRDFPFQVKRGDIFEFMESLRRRGNSDRTVYNKFCRVAAFLRFTGVPKSVIPERPKFERKLPTTYEPENFRSILQAAEPRLRLALTVALKCGLREQELMHLEFRDINLSAKTLRVRGKEEWGFKVKDSEERDVPVPADLLAELKTWHLDQPERKLLFGTRSGTPDGHFLRRLKSTAREAALNCGRCRGCRGKSKECSLWTLHKFRRSYLTTLLRQGVDLRTVQAFAGHSDLASTMRYLRPADAEQVHETINAIEW